MNTAAPLATGLHSRQTDTQLLLAAIAFAADRHRRQRRKDADATPYVNHVIAVAQLLADEVNAAPLALLCAAILHDTVEDTPTTPDELRGMFGNEVTQLVLEVSDDKQLAKQERKRLQIEHASRLSHPARLIKLADKTCNLRDVHASPPADWPVSRRREYFDWSKAVVDEIRGAHAGLEALFDQAYRLRP